jgi:manganese/zinc/iron transport system permease protein
MFFVDYFTDPVLSAPLIGCMLMCLVASLVGVFVHLRRQSLVGEALAHACYPGVLLALLIEQLFLQSESSGERLLIVLLGAFVSCFLGMYLINLLQRRFSVPADSALCFVLASFFGVGLTILSATQTHFPTLYRHMQSYLFGQAATMTETYVLVYGVLSVLVLMVIICFYRPIKMVLFDAQFAEIVGVNRKKIEALLQCMVVLAIVIGVRSVGVVLISAMLIFPAASAKAWTSSLATFLPLAGVIGLFCGFFGVFMAHEMSLFFRSSQGAFISFPTGPMIVMVACGLFFFSWCFAPNKGFIFREVRRLRFLIQCQQENLLKVIWKFCVAHQESIISRQHLQDLYQKNVLCLNCYIFLLQRRGWLASCGPQLYKLTSQGMLWARKIVRLHRLWEVYLVEYCGLAKERVHPLAEEMEHIILPEIEEELNKLLQHPVKDPHAQPIPPQEERFLLSENGAEDR